MRLFEEVTPGSDELEPLRLADLEHLSHEEVGEMMNVSRAMAGGILAEARRKTTAALVHGYAIRVEGGVVKTINDDEGCHVSFRVAAGVAGGVAGGEIAE